MIKLEIDTTHRIIKKVYTEALTTDIIKKGIEEIIHIREEHPEIEAMQVDLRECDFQLTPEESKYLSQHNFYDSRLPHKIALIADSPFKTALSLIFKEYASRKTLEIFNTVQAAEEWLQRGY